MADDVAHLVQQARQQSLGDLPRRTAKRFPDKPAIVDGDHEPHLRRARRRRRPGRRRARRRRAGEGRPARAAVPQLLAVRGARLRDRPGRRRAGAGELHARRRRDRAHPRPQRRDGVRRRGRAASTSPTRALEAHSTVDHDGASSDSPTATCPDGWRDVAGVVRPRRHAARGARRRRRPGAADVHLRHRVAARRARCSPAAACCGSTSPARSTATSGPTTSSCTRCRSTTARSSTCSSDPTSTLGATSVILPGPDPAAVLRAIEEHRRHQVLRAADGLDRPAALARLRRRRPVLAREGLLRRVARCRSRSSRRSSSGCPTSGSGTSTARPRWRRSPPSLGPDEQLSHAGLGRPRRPQRRDPHRRRRTTAEVPAGEVGEIVHRSPHATLGYYDDEEKTAEAFRGRLVPLRRPRLRRRRRPALRRRPQEGHDQDRRRERRQPRGRGGDLRARRRRRGRRLRRPPPALGRGGHRRRGRQGRRHPVARRRHRARPRRPRRLQGARSTSCVADALPKNPSGKILKRQLRDEHADLARPGTP